jgi:MFS family permease
VRRLLILSSSVVLVDTMLYAALAPLLPRFTEELDLSKATAGLLVSAYATGVLVGAVPGGIAAARFGPRHAVIGGLALIGAASVAFGLAGDPWTLGCSRLLQGFGSALSWAGALSWLVAGTPPSRRGEMLGTALGAAVFGALLGPALGAAADVLDPLVAFGAVGAACAGLLVWALRTPGAPGERVDGAAVARAARDRTFLGGLYLMSLPAFLFGIVSVLVPLRLGDLGWGAVAIAAIFVAGASIEMVGAPVVGRLSDRRGRLGVIRVALAASLAVSIGLAWSDRALSNALLVLAASAAYGALFVPAMALVSSGAEHVGLAQGLAFGLMNACWAVGNAVGPSLGGILGEVAGDAVPFVLASGLCLATLVVVWRPGVLRPVGPGPT